MNKWTRLLEYCIFQKGENMIYFSEVSSGRIIMLNHIMTFVHHTSRVEGYHGMVELSTGKTIPLTQSECIQLKRDLREANVMIHNCYREEK